MSPKLKALAARLVVKGLKRAGFTLVSQKGSHMKFQHPDGRKTIVPAHRTIAAGTLNSILGPDQADIPVDQFMEYIQ